MKALPASLVPVLQRQRERLHESLPGTVLATTGEQAEALDRLLLASDYALDQLGRQPGLVAALDQADPELVLAPAQAQDWPMLLRRHRHAASVRLIHRDVNGIDRLEDTLAATSELAERCIDTALAALQTTLEREHGVPRDVAGQAQRLVVFGLGKLGGGELNFSSDVDLVFAYPAAGSSDGNRALDNAVWFQRLGQRLIQLLAGVDTGGMAYRVDMRLRPFGQAGKLALSFASMEQYFQREGRDWERYAWIKARPVAGDLAQGMRFLDTLRPFIYRRYLDFDAIEGLREMKAMIEAEVVRREREADLKLGRGGIREIEFIVQLQQMIRGGREPDLRLRGLLPALAQLRQRGHIPEHGAECLLAAYRFLRTLENRVQMLREEQTHLIPDDPLDRARLAFGLGFPDWQALEPTLERHRAAVAREFARVFEARHAGVSPSTRIDAAQFDQTWRRGSIAELAPQLERAGFADPATLLRALESFAVLPALTLMSTRARERTDRIVPLLLAGAAASSAPDAVALRGLALVQAVLRRSSYLALLDERPAALARLVDVLAASRWMAERLCQHPLLLDELLDVRADAHPPTRGEVGDALARALAGIAGEDLEARLHALNEFRQGFAFRVARARIVDGQPAAECTRQLAFVAEAVVNAVLEMAREDIARRHGRLPQDGLAAIAYGSFGGKELGLESDLDLVFLYDGAHAAGESDGARPLDAVRYHTRVVQKVIALLALPTPAGSLYEVDLRLRPDGGKGLLVTSVESFSTYQSARAWTWEQQALVRARAVAGDAAVIAAFAQVRDQVLCAARVPAQLRADATAMRQRMRAELDRSHAQQFDLKQGEGGLVDLEFLLQAGVLQHAHANPAVIAGTRTPDLIDALTACGHFDVVTAQALHGAHDILASRLLACTLDGRARVVAIDPELDGARTAVMRTWRDWAATTGTMA